MVRHRFSKVDTILFRMDNPVDPINVTGVLVLGAPMDLELLKATIETRLLRLNRFRQRVVPSLLPWRRPYWEDAPGLDLDYHVQTVILPPPGDEAALLQTVSELIVTPLDMARPPWQMHLVEAYGPGGAIICRTHHSLADGVALVHVLQSLADSDAGGSRAGTEQEHAQRGAKPRRKRGLVRRVVRRGLRTLDYLARGPELAQVADHALTQAGGALALAGDVLAQAGEILSRPPDSDTGLRGVPSLTKQVALSGPVPLVEIKTTGRRLGGTVNDVLMTALAGGLRRYLQGQQDLPADVSLHALLAVNWRPQGVEAELGNRISALFLPLPVDIADPEERLAEVKRKMDGLKHSPQASMVLAALEVVSQAPSTALTLALSYLTSKATVLVTNVKGPQERFYLAGVPVKEVMFWIPRYGGIGLGISIVSYAGQVRMGVISDKDLVPDPENIIAGFRDELNDLLALAMESKRPISVKELPAMLDYALTTLDELAPGETEERASG